MPTEMPSVSENRQKEETLRSDSNLPWGRIWAGVDLTTVFLRGVSPAVSGSEWHF